MPKLRLKRLIKLQAVMKGYYVRKYKIPYVKLKNKMIENFVISTINSLIEVVFVKLEIRIK